MNYITQNNPAIQPRGGRNFAFVFTLVMLLFAAQYSFAQHPAPAIFHRLISVSPEKRPLKAEMLYKDNFRKVGEAEAMRALDALQSVARQLGDLSLEGTVFICRADYYSVKRGFNALSTRYHQEAVAFARQHDLLLDEGIYLHKMAYYYFVYSRNTDACRHFLEAYEKFRQRGFKSVPNLSQYLAEQGSFFYNLKDWDNANSLLQNALKYPSTTPRDRASILNSIGLIYRGRQQYNAALEYFHRTLKVAQNAKDSAWVGIATGNIGSVYFLQGNYERAMPLITEDYKISLKFNDSINAGIALLRMVRVNVDGNKISLAHRQLDTVAMLIGKRWYQLKLNLQAEFYQLRSVLFQKDGKLQQAIDYDKKYEAAKDSLTRRDNIAAVENVKLKFEVETHRREINRLEERMKVGKFKRNAVIFILFLLAVIIILLFNHHRLKAAKNQQLLLAEKRRVDEELANAARSLKQYTENLRKNNLLIEKIKAELAQVKAQSNNDGNNHLEQLLSARLMTAEAWDEFKRLFMRVHHSFFTNLRNKYPNLTDTDTRLLSLIKLGLSNREMSNMLGVTIEGIKKSKQRLRKKMELEPEHDLEQVVALL